MSSAVQIWMRQRWGRLAEAALELYPLTAVLLAAVVLLALLYRLAERRGHAARQPLEIVLATAWALPLLAWAVESGLNLVRYWELIRRWGVNLQDPLAAFWLRLFPGLLALAVTAAVVALVYLASPCRKSRAGPSLATTVGLMVGATLFDWGCLVFFLMPLTPTKGVATPMPLARLTAGQAATLRSGGAIEVSGRNLDPELDAWIWAEFPLGGGSLPPPREPPAPPGVTQVVLVPRTGATYQAWIDVLQHPSTPVARVLWTVSPAAAKSGAVTDQLTRADQLDQVHPAD